jgi:hypothetical protein
MLNLEARTAKVGFIALNYIVTIYVLNFEVKALVLSKIYSIV